MIGNCKSRPSDFGLASLCGAEFTASMCVEGSDLFWGGFGFTRTSCAVSVLVFWVNGSGFGSHSASLSCGLSRAAASFCSKFSVIGRFGFAARHGSALGTSLVFRSHSPFCFGSSFLMKESAGGGTAAAETSVRSGALFVSGVLLEIHNPNNHFNNRLTWFLSSLYTLKLGPKNTVQIGRKSAGQDRQRKLDCQLAGGKLWGTLRLAVELLSLGMFQRN